MGYRELIKKVQEYSGLSDKESREALEHTVESLAGQLTEGERQDFASQLPTELQDVALSAETQDKQTKKDILQFFKEKYDVEETHAKEQIIAAWQALKDTVSPGEIEDMRTQLPNRTTALLQ